MALLTLALGACDPPTYCSDGCVFAYDGECDDGREGATTGFCVRGSDCTDCGPNPDVDLSDELGGDGPSPPDGAPRSPPQDWTPPGLITCQCPAPVMCGRPAAPGEPPPSSGGPFFYECGGHGGTGPCVTTLVTCPGARNGPPGVEFQCRDGEHGVGCYAISNTGCEVVGVCNPPSRYGLELAEDVVPPTIEHCARYGDFIGPAEAGGEFLWNVAQCESYYQVEDQVASCGACAEGCDVFLTGGPNPCHDYYLSLAGPPPGGGPSPTCRDAIRSIVDSFSSSNSCTNRCLEVFYDCAAESDCRDLASCDSSARSCARSC